MLIGQSLGRYHILEHASTLRRCSRQASLSTSLGEGGMATVYKAYNTRLVGRRAEFVMEANVLVMF